ncbi:hypothetical protein [Glycomyces sp. NPDC048151]|uniref:hypothetical protein n=1 Tax=Glycomyces sp. NPDC048151 TaxID=3364002 RepID=UPI003714BC71
MNYHQEWADESGELSEFDLADSAEPPAEDDPEAAVEEPEALPDEVDPADAAEQRREVPQEDDEHPE